MSKSPEKLLQKSRGGGQYICDIDEEGMYAVTYIFLQKMAVSYKEHKSPFTIVELF